MTMTTAPRTTIDEWIPDDRVIDDCRRVVVVDCCGKIEYDHGVVEVPDDVRFDVLSKAYISPRIEIGFGECFRTLVAIGGLIASQNGIARASFGFATLWHNVHGSLITVDFSEDFPM